MKKNIWFDYDSKYDTCTLKTRRKKAFKEMQKTGAVIEQGVAISFFNNIVDKDNCIIEPNTNSMIKPTMPYFEHNTLYCPLDNYDEIIQLYKEINKLFAIPEKYDLRQKSTLTKKIRFIVNKIVSSTPKAALASLWILQAVIWGIQGKKGLAILDCFVAFFQLDFYEIIPIIMKSTMSYEKKKMLLEHVKEHYLNPEEIQKYDNIQYYAKFDMQEDTDSTLEMIKEHFK